MSIPNDLARTEHVMQAQPAVTAEQRSLLQQAAERLSLVGAAAAKAELCNVALERLALLLYAPDSDGGAVHYDPATNRVLVATPWGRKGCRQWGIRPSEARVLAAIMLARSAQPNAWLRYDPGSKSWLIDGKNAPTMGRAVLLLQRNPISPAEWREHEAKLRSSWAETARRKGRL